MTLVSNEPKKQVMTMITFFKVGIVVIVITFTSWLSQKKPELAGFIIALPLASLVILVMSHLQSKNAENSILFAKSILIGVPISYLFFLPFFIPSLTKYGFWVVYGVGIFLLCIGFIAHRTIVSWIS